MSIGMRAINGGDDCITKHHSISSGTGAKLDSVLG